jgi:AcrR family transcriptional regulator
VVTETGTNAESRTPLSKDRVLRAAVGLADRGGIDALSMRKLGQELGVEAMALYRHVRDKDDILDGIVEVVIGEIAVLDADGDWKTALRNRVMAAREVMLRHPWAPRVMEERKTVGPAFLAYLNAVMAILRAGGFSLELAHHTIHVLGSRILGFDQDLFEDKNDPRPEPEAAASLARAMAEHYPYLAELALAATHDGGLGGCDDDVEFAFGLDLILDGLEALRAGSLSSPSGDGPGESTQRVAGRAS